MKFWFCTSLFLFFIPKNAPSSKSNFNSVIFLKDFPKSSPILEIKFLSYYKKKNNSKVLYIPWEILTQKWCTRKHLRHDRTKEYFDSRTRWWHRSLLNFPSPTDTPNIQLYMEKLPLRAIQRRVEWFLYTGWLIKHKQVEKAEKHSDHKSHHWHSTIQSERNPHPILPEEWRPHI